MTSTKREPKDSVTSECPAAGVSNANLLTDNVSGTNGELENSEQNGVAVPEECGKPSGSSAGDSVTGAHSSVKCELLKCKVCREASTGSYLLKLHIDEHIKKLHRCSFCPASFMHQTSLTAHTKRHTGVGMHSCQLCPAEFIAPSMLRRHMLVHTGEKPFKCEHCPATFGEKAKCKSHMRSHTGEKKYRCEFCPAAYTKCSNLRKHLKAHCGDKQYKCTSCPASFHHPAALRIHLQVHGEEVRHRCELCDEEFTNRTALKCHMRTHSRRKSQESERSPSVSEEGPD